MNKIHLIQPQIKNVIVKIDNKSMVLNGTLEEPHGELGIMKYGGLVDGKLILHKHMVIKFIKVQCNKIIKF